MTSGTKRNVLVTLTGLQLQNRFIALLVEEKLDEHGGPGGGQYFAGERKGSEKEDKSVINCRSSVGSIC